MFRKFCPTRPEGAEAHKAARLKGQKPIKQHALKGRVFKIRIKNPV